MPLISCPNCAASVSGSAVACPKCGVPLTPAPPNAEELRAARVAAQGYVQKVVVTDIDVSFGQLVFLMIKITFAAIPAAIIVGFIVAIMGAVFGGLLAGLKH